jgi:hypothetical protein
LRQCPGPERIEGIYRGPGFLAVKLIGSSPTPFHQQVVSLSQSSCVSPRSSLLMGDGEGVREEPNHTTL